LREKKVYQYNTAKVKRKIISVLRKRKRESTVADLITQTGLPKYQIGETLKIVMDNYYGQMKVTESGQILYYFPGGLRNKKKGFIPGFKRISAKVFRTAGRVLTTLFKIWIMVMLVGYALIFAALVLFSIAVSIAGSGSSGGRRRGRGGGFGSFYLTARLIDLILYSSVSKKRNSFGNSRQKSRPLHKSIFAFVFGDGDPNKGWELTEKRNAIGFIQKNKGTITIDELMMISGREHSSAHHLINNLLLEYQGSPEVSDKGSLYYRFPELMYTTKNISNTDYEAESRKLIPFNQNKSKTNKWIAFFNGFNFVFGSYFIYFSAFAGAEVFRSRISLLYQIPRAYFPLSGAFRLFEQDKKKIKKRHRNMDPAGISKARGLLLLPGRRQLPERTVFSTLNKLNLENI